MKKRTAALTALLLCAAFLLAACSSNSDSSSKESEMTEDYNMQYSSSDEAVMESSANENSIGGTATTDISEASSSSEIFTDENVKLIRRAELSIETQNFDETAEALKALITSYNGYFQQSELYTGGYYGINAKNAYYIIRVPSTSYDAFMSQTGELAHLVSCVESTENIGEQYYNTELLLLTQETKHQRLLSLLEESGDMEQMLQVERELSDTEYEINYLNSTLKRYDSLVDYATFTVSLQEVGELTELSSVEAVSFGQRLADGFSSGLTRASRTLQNLLIWMAYHFIFLIFLAAVFVVVLLALRSRRRKKNTKIVKATEAPLKHEEDKK